MMATDVSNDVACNLPHPERWAHQSGNSVAFTGRLPNFEAQGYD
jgi:hypothetical protein